jgi:NDP-sugar pyrophosphorylase family protein
MAEIGGRPFLEYLVNRLQNHGVPDVIICAGYMKEKIASHFAPRVGHGVRVVEEDVHSVRPGP